MTLRLTLGIDPGQTGAIAALADGEPVAFIDMPTVARRAGGQQVDAVGLTTRLRAVIGQHPGANVISVLEQVGAMPKQGVASTFRFGQSDGIVRGVLGALRIPLVEVPPATWKKLFRLPTGIKDAARGYAIQRFPSIAEHLSRKRDIGRADALLIAHWAEQTEKAAKQ